MPRSDTGPFALVPEWVLDAPVSDRAIRLYAVLARYADKDDGTCWPKRKTLADRLGCSPDSIDRARNELVELGALVVEQQTWDDGAQAPNLYTVARVRPPLCTDAEAPLRAPAAPRNESQKEREQRPGVALSLVAETDANEGEPVRVVYDAWVASTGRTRSLLTEKRRKLIRARLADGYTVDELVAAASGWQRSAFHRGDNDDGKVWNDLELIFRDGAHVERFRDAKDGDTRPWWHAK